MSLNNTNNTNNTNNNTNMKELQLELGDIIRIKGEEYINNEIYIIDYLDNDLIKLINTGDYSELSVNIEETGELSDKRIQEITILNKSKEKGYAKQNGLIVGSYINIIFGGELPTIITGEITNLEEDMIEVKTIPNDELIYIDFEYKGIPKDIPIKKIELRGKPLDEDNNNNNNNSNKIKREGNAQYGDEDKDEDEDILQEDTDGDRLLEYYSEPVIDMKGKMGEILKEGEDIIIGDDLGSIEQIVEVDEDKKRYNISVQLADLLDDLLSTLPNSERTTKKLNEINLIIEKYKQLHREYSEFNERGYANKPKKKGALYKPLIDNIKNIDRNLYWLLPVVNSKRNLYDIGPDDIGTEDIATGDIDDERDLGTDIRGLNLTQELLDLENALDEYNNNTIVGNGEEGSKYKEGMKNVLDKLSSYVNISEREQENIKRLNKEQVNDDIHCVLANIAEEPNGGDYFMSSTVNNKDCGIGKPKENNTIDKQSFIIQKYNLGQKKYKREKGEKKSRFEKITDNDEVVVSSFLTLPESVMNYSRITLPVTNILMKSNLGLEYLYYFKLLKQGINIKNIEINVNKEGLLEHNPDTYLSKNFHHYIYDRSSQNGSGVSKEQYETFLDNMIPKTRTLFNLIKNDLHGKLSMVQVIDYLEPFMIYKEDISFKQYDEIRRFIYYKITETRKLLRNKEEKYKKILNHKYPGNYKINNSGLILSQEILSSDLLKQTITSYVLNTENSSSSELLKRILSIDGGNIYNSSILQTNISLIHNNIDIDDLDKDKIDNLFKLNEEKLNRGKNNGNGNGDGEDDTCKEFVIAKIYKSLINLNNDNNKTIYYDIDLDPTRYSTLDEHRSEQSIMEEGEFLEHMTEIIKENVGLDVEQAVIEARAIINGKREVEEDVYALLEVVDGDIGSNSGSGSIDRTYWKRVDKVWEKDDELSSEAYLDIKDGKMFCNIKPNCVTVEDDCKNVKDARFDINKSLIEKIRDNFDIKQEISFQEQQDKIANNIQYNIRNAEYLKRLKLDIIFKINDEQLMLGNDITEDDLIISPYNELRDRILGDSDIVSKQNNIIRFTDKYTRRAKPTDDINWYYCNKTGVKLLPAFLYKLASAYVGTKRDNGDYLTVLEQICAQYGELSDDGDSIVDKHSGYIIRKIDYNTDEGYDDTGYRVKTREELVKDLGETVLDMIMVQGEDSKGLKDIIPKNATTTMINNVISAISENMNVNLEDDRVNIVTQVMLKIKKEMPSKEKYQERMKMSKKAMPDYDIVKNEFLLIMTISYVAIFLQTMIPSPRSKKTFPGCTKSFEGYPLSSDKEDTSGLKYIACIVFNMKTRTSAPWNSISGKKGSVDNIIKKMIGYIDKFIYNDGIVQDRISQKIEYNKKEVIHIIPEELDISKWTTFLPPIIRLDIKLDKMQTLSSQFYGRLNNNLQTGVIEQHDNINAIKGKILLYSLALQLNINNIIKKAAPLLRNSDKEPFIDNVCCNDTGISGINVYEFISDNDKQFTSNIDIIKSLSNVLYTIKLRQRLNTLFDARNTKMTYPSVEEEYSEKIIYKSFIHYCKIINPNDKGMDNGMNNGMNMYEELDESLDETLDDSLNKELSEESKLCINVDIVFDKDNTLEEKILMLKDQGINYDNKSLASLMSIISKRSILSSVSNISESGKEIKSTTDRFSELVYERLNKIKTIQRDDLEDISLLEGIEYIDVSSKESYEVIPKNVYESIKNVLETIDKPFDKEERDNPFNKLYNILYNTNKELYSKIEGFILNNVGGSRNKNSKLIKEFISNIENDKDTDDIASRKIVGYQNYIKNMLILFPELIKNNHKIDEYKIHGHWKLSQKHIGDIKDIITGYYEKLFKTAVNDKDKQFLNKVTENNAEILNILDVIPSINIKKDMDMVDNNAIFDNKTILELNKLIFLLTFTFYIDITTNEDIEVEDEEIRPMVANLLISYIGVYMDNMPKINMSYEDVKNKIIKTREAEKNKIVLDLGILSEEQREIQNNFKNLQLGTWNVGLQKGLREYVGERYDQEREQVDDEQVFDDTKEALDMEGIPDDDNPGEDMDGDEYF